MVAEEALVAYLEAMVVIRVMVKEKEVEAEEMAAVQSWKAVFY